MKDGKKLKKLKWKMPYVVNHQVMEEKEHFERDHMNKLKNYIEIINHFYYVIIL